VPGWEIAPESTQFADEAHMTDMFQEWLEMAKEEMRKSGLWDEANDDAEHDDN
jgi:hypothetical protein